MATAATARAMTPKSGDQLGLARTEGLHILRWPRAHMLLGSGVARPYRYASTWFITRGQLSQSEVRQHNPELIISLRLDGISYTPRSLPYFPSNIQEPDQGHLYNA